jgi:hypothetical protein
VISAVGLTRTRGVRRRGRGHAQQTLASQRVRALPRRR